MYKRPIPALLIALILMGIAFASSASETAMAQSGVPIYGLVGTIQKSPQPQFDDFFMAADGQTYGIVGANAGIEQEIIRLRDVTPAPTVKIWGTLYEGVADVSGRQIVITEILVEGQEGTGGQTPQAMVGVDVLNVRAGPSTAYPVVGKVNKGDVYDIVGKSAGRRPWYLICCLANGADGWVSGDLILTTGNTGDVPVVLAPPPPKPTPPPQPPSYSGWKATYFANPTLTPPPAGFSDVPDINFNWGTGSPYPGVPSDDFSIRFERTIDFAPNLYRLSAQADDGVRVWLDGQLIIDEWHGATGETYSAVRQLAGPHTIKVEYYEAIGEAGVRFWWGIETPQVGQWLASYFGGVSLGGNPLWVAVEWPGGMKIDYNWGHDSPVPGTVPADNWSGRWQGKFQFEQGDYVFNLYSDDGARLWLDGHEVIDAWYDGAHPSENGFNNVGAGTHTVTVEYYERVGAAILTLEWYRWTPGGGYRPAP